MERKNYKISREVFKFPYNGNNENEDDQMLSEKICLCTIKARKNIFRKTKRVFVYGQLIASVSYGLAPIPATSFISASRIERVCEVADSDKRVILCTRRRLV